MPQKKPAHEIRLGKIKTAIWANESDDGEVWFNVTVNRSYRVGDEWKESSSFRRDDLPVVSKSMDLAFAWIWSKQNGKAAISDDSQS